jgi:hypothetical protein
MYVSTYLCHNTAYFEANSGYSHANIHSLCTSGSLRIWRGTLCDETKGNKNTETDLRSKKYQTHSQTQAAKRQALEDARTRGKRWQRHKNDRVGVVCFNGTHKGIRSATTAAGNIGEQTVVPPPAQLVNSKRAPQYFIGTTAAIRSTSTDKENQSMSANRCRTSHVTRHTETDQEQEQQMQQPHTHSTIPLWPSKGYGSTSLATRCRHMALSSNTTSMRVLPMSVAQVSNGSIGTGEIRGEVEESRLLSTPVRNKRTAEASEMCRYAPISSTGVDSWSSASASASASASPARRPTAATASTPSTLLHYWKRSRSSSFE